MLDTLFLMSSKFLCLKALCGHAYEGILQTYKSCSMPTLKTSMKLHSNTQCHAEHKLIALADKLCRADWTLLLTWGCDAASADCEQNELIPSISCEQTKCSYSSS